MNVPTVKPIIHSTIKDFLNEKELLRELVSKYSSPVHVLFPQIVQENVSAFKNVFDKHSVQGKIYFSHKTNRAESILQEILKLNMGVEVSSRAELQRVLHLNFKEEDILASGPKNNAYLKEALNSKVLICIDNIQELEDIIAHQKPVSVVLRISGFKSEKEKIIPKESRFGIAISDLDHVFSLLSTSKDIVKLNGFSFHIDSANDKEKVIAIDSLLKETLNAKKKGHPVSIINIGGGYKVSYTDEESWQDLITYLQKNALQSTSANWNNYDYGFYSSNGSLRGGYSYYDGFNKGAKEKHLDSLLSAQLDSGNVGRFISEMMLSLVIEPGRALVDQVGVTIAPVSFVKKSSLGNTLVGLDLNIKNITAGQEFPTDPLIYYKKENKSKPVDAYFIGNIPLENDVLYKRKIHLEHLPEPGDIAVFVNSAGYYMDFSESPFIHQALPKRISVTNKGGAFNYSVEKAITI